MKTPVNANTIRQHMTYSWWKYVLAAVLVVFGVNLYFTVTTYRSPAEKQVNVYIYGYANEETLNAYMSSVREEKMSDMEEMRCLVMTTDGTYGPMQLTTYIAAAEGDLYILPRDQFISLAAEGAFLELEYDEELMALFTDAGASLQSGWRKNTALGETHLYGIPLNKLPGLSQYCYVENGFIAALVNSGNDENVLKFLRILSADMITEPEETAETAEAGESVETAASTENAEAEEAAGN